MSFVMFIERKLNINRASQEVYMSSFVDHLCLVFVMLSRLVVTCWERADLLALVCDVLL